MAKRKREKIRKVVIVRDKDDNYKLKKLEGKYGEKGLKTSWMTFIDEFMANGMNGTKAYMAAFENKNKKSSSVEAIRVLNYPSVQNEIKARLNSQKITSDAIKNELWEIATTYRGHKTIGTAVNALTTLARISGMIKEGERGDNFFQNNYLVYSPIISADADNVKLKEETKKIIKTGGRLIE